MAPSFEASEPDQTQSPSIDTNSASCPEETVQDPDEIISTSSLEASETDQSFEEKVQDSISTPAFESAETDQCQSLSTALTSDPCFDQFSNEKISASTFEAAESDQTSSSSIFKDLTTDNKLVLCFEEKDQSLTDEKPPSTDLSSSSSISTDVKLASPQSSTEEKTVGVENEQVPDDSASRPIFEAAESDQILSSAISSDDKLVSCFEDTNQVSSETEFTSCVEYEVTDQIQANFSDLSESADAEQILSHLPPISCSEVVESFQTSFQFCDSVTCLQDDCRISTPNFTVQIPTNSTDRESRLTSSCLSHFDDVIFLDDNDVIE